MRFKGPFLATLGFLSISLFAHADTYDFIPLATSSGDIGNVGFTSGGFEIEQATVNGPIYTIFPIQYDGASHDTYVLDRTFGGLLMPPLTVTDATTGQTTTVYSGAFGETSIDAYGDVGFIAYNSFEGRNGDTNVLAINETANGAAVTPEPSSFALLSTGLLAGLGAIKRRYA